jgi:glycosyltransferase involved in cell wall biosynthesis
MAAELVKQITALGATVDIAVLDNEGRGNEQIFEAVGHAAAATHRIRSRGKFDPSVVRALKRIKSSRGIDVVHSHKYKSTFYATFARNGASRLITTYHNWLCDTRALRLYAAVDKRLARFNDLCIAVSTPVATELRRHVDPRRVLQFDNGIDIERYRPTVSREAAKASLGLAPQRLLLGFVGRLSPEKGLFSLLDAVRSLAHREFDVVIAGDGELRPALQSWIDAAGMTERIRLLGDRRDTPAIYAALDVLVLPSLQEAFPMVLLEAMAARCAVIASEVGEVGRIVRHGIDGDLVAPGQVAALRDAIDRSLGDAARRHRLGSSAQARVEANFSSRSMAASYLGAYESVMRR